MQASRKRTVPDGVVVKEIHSFDDRFDRFWEKVKQTQNVWICRTSQFLNWRYIHSPLSKYWIYEVEGETTREILGYVVISEGERFGLRLGLIIDLVVLPGRIDIASILVRRGIDCLQEIKADAVGCLMLKHQPVVRALKENGMLYVPHRFSPRMFHVTVAPLTTDEKFNIFIANAKNWYLTLGDTDIV
jgi:hypothetical protein